MSQKSTSTVVIDAPLADVQAALFSIESYPEWLSSIKKVDVIERDSQNRVTKAKLTIDAGMMKDRVILDYDWSSMQIPPKSPTNLRLQCLCLFLP